MAENYIRIQEDIANKIQKARSNFKKSPKERITLSYIETRQETLEQHWSVFLSTHRKLIFEIKREELEKSSYIVNDIYDHTEELYIEYKSMLKEVLLRFKNESKKVEVSKSSESVVKLPKISIPSFSGSYSEWVSFRDLFVSLVHNNSYIDNVQKLHYLKSSITGEAEQLLRHIPVTANNYLTCWEQLCNRFNNKKYIANCLLQRLINQKRVVTESSSEIKSLLDVTHECLQGLKNLDIDIKSWDIIIIFIISSKLDSESRKQWEQQTSDCNQDLPSYDQFRKFLESRFRSLEFLSPQTQKQQKQSFTHVATQESCVFCTQNHKIFNCKDFAKQPVDARRSFVQTNRLCYNCFNPDHSVYQCKVSNRCRLCNKKHHSLLHFSPKIPQSTPEQTEVGQSVDNKVVATVAASLSQAHGESNSFKCVSDMPHSQVLLATALVKAESVRRSSIMLRALIDQGSQACFITESAVQMLGLKKMAETSIISGLGGDQGSKLQSKSTVLVKIQSRLDPSFVIDIKCHVLCKLTSFLPTKRVQFNYLPTISPTILADPSFATPNKIDLLLGAEVYSNILLEGLLRNLPGSLIAQQTRLGWILSGYIPGHNLEKDENVVVSTHLIHQDENELLRKFWELESEPSSILAKHLTEEEKRCEDYFVQTTTRDASGRYTVRLPFKIEDPLSRYGGSQDIARKRLQYLERRLSKNPELQVEYNKVLDEYLSSGHMEIVNPENWNDSKAVYLPHHAVVRQDKTTTKVRVVFDASCKNSNGASLNSDLMVGPTIQPELRHLVMRWRCYPIALIADIVKMYRQVQIAEPDQDYQRILWRCHPGKPVEHFRLKRVTFGTSSAPYLAVRCLQQLACDEGNNFPLVSTRVVTDFYMDDFLSGCYSVDEGQKIYHQMTEMLGRAGFPLQKWSSNSSELLHLIQGQQLTDTNNLELKVDETMKILGLAWNREADEFRCTVQLPPLDYPVTKRKVISDIAKLFDPLGWLAPTITIAKSFIQQLWLSGIGWDSELPAILLEDWEAFRSDLNALSQINIPRWIQSGGDDISFELHGFSDASNKAYAAVVYARIIDTSGLCTVHLITSKTRIAPIKQVSIPRLELCGAVLLSKLLSEVAEVLKVPKNNLHGWTDSTIVLAWQRSHPSRWKTFVANRVSEILTTLDGTQWSHVASQDNPADCASRGMQPSELVNYKLWYEGPGWLRNEEIEYGKANIEDTDLEEKKGVRCHVAANEDEEEILIKFSSLYRLTRIIALCRRVLRWKKSEREKYTKENKCLTAKELCESLLTCIRICQRKYFKADMESLRNTGKLENGSKLTNLNAFLDEKQILRVGGRLHNSNLAAEMKHPIILPHESHLTKLVIDEAHKKTMHGGPQLMLNYVRSRYWVIGAKNLIRQFVRKCVTCIRYSAQTQQQMMGRLPASRVSAHKPFHNSGVDYAGPINVRCSRGRGQRSEKGYICLFVCMATRAIHLEVVSDMTSKSFLAAFRRFVARRGHVAELWSDNGTTFVGASRELKDLFEVEQSGINPEIINCLATMGTSWHFIPPHSPNFGGLWEAGVKSTKYHLKRILGNSTLTFEEMTTTLCQIEACLNSRPLSQLPSNSEDPVPLTPGYFLVGEPLVVPPDFNYEDVNISPLKRWQLIQRMLQDFWRRWSFEYLTELQNRYKWNVSGTEPTIDQIVLIKEDDLPPCKWLMVRIVNLHPGLDGVTRVVSLKCKNSVIKRPLSKVIRLPIAE